MPALTPDHDRLHTPFRILLWVSILYALRSVLIFYEGPSLADRVMQQTQSDWLSTVIDLAVTLFYAATNLLAVGMLLTWWELTRQDARTAQWISPRALRTTRAFVLAFALLELANALGTRAFAPREHQSESALWTMYAAESLVNAASLAATLGATVCAASYLRAFLRADQGATESVVASAIIRAAAVIYPLFFIALVAIAVMQAAFIDQYTESVERFLHLLWKILNLAVLALVLLFAFLYHECAKRTRPPRAPA